MDCPMPIRRIPLERHPPIRMIPLERSPWDLWGRDAFRTSILEKKIFGVT